MSRSKPAILTIVILLVILSFVLVWMFFGSSPSTVRITAEEFRFVPAIVELDAFQDVRFVIRNQGRERHIFKSSFFSNRTVSIEGESSDSGLQDGLTIHLSPGKSVSFIAKFTPGLYPFRCLVQGHRGMEGTLVIR